MAAAFGIGDCGYELTLAMTLPVNERLLCAKCGKILRSPMQTGCGCVCCKNCIGHLWTSPRPICPHCGSEMDKNAVFNDANMEREVLDLDVRCEAAADGCEWRGKLRIFEEHMSRCQFKTSVCQGDGCTAVLQRQFFHEHWQTECEYTRVMCDLCDGSIIARHKQQHKADDCPMRLVTCPECNALVPHSKVTVHQERICPEHLLPCSSFGCTDMVKRSDIITHNLSESANHNRLLTNAILETKAENRDLRSSNAEQEKEQEAKINDLHSTVAELKKELEAEINDLRSTVAELKKELEAEEAKSRQRGEQYENATSSMNEAQKQVRQLTERLEAAESSMKNMEEKLLEQRRMPTDIQADDLNLRAYNLDVKTTNGVLIWKIGDMGRRRREAISGRTPSLYSAPFYTSPAGYKMCARIYLDGPKKCNMRNCPIPQLKCTSCFVVYEATCNVCRATYIGSTTRPLHTRVSEHLRAAIRRDKASALGEHYATRHPAATTPDVSFSIVNATEPDKLKVRIC